MRLIFAIFAVFAIVIVLYFDRLNPEAVTINLSSNYSYTISMVGFFLVSFALGCYRNSLHPSQGCKEYIPGLEKQAAAESGGTCSGDVFKRTVRLFIRQV